VKRNIWRLPVDVPYVPKRRRLSFVVYALLSGAYSYSILYLVAGFVGNVFRNFNPEWSFIPELLTALLIFRSRIRTLENFMKFVYLDKKDRVVAWFTPARTLAVSAVLLIFLLLPLWHESVSGQFLLEPARHSTVRAVTPGIVTAILVNEGDAVDAGKPIAELRNLPLQSRLALTQANYENVAARANAAVLRFQNVGAASQQRELLQAQTAELKSQAAKLNLTSAISGTVITPRVQDKVGSYVTAGTEIAEIADLSAMRARIYISEYQMSKFRIGSKARVEVQGAVGKWNAQVNGISLASSEIHPELADRAQYKGLNPPMFYVVDLRIENPAGRLKPGMSGLARVYGRRISAGEYLWTGIADFFGRKLW
jgi:putative peptide zinc metalloprotease protein